MSRSTITIRAKKRSDYTEVRLKVDHPMIAPNCQFQDQAQELTALYIQELRCFYQKQLVLTAQLGVNIAETPYFAFRFIGGEIGDKILISWVDNQGNRDDQSAEIF